MLILLKSFYSDCLFHRQLVSYSQPYPHPTRPLNLPPNAPTLPSSIECYVVHYLFYIYYHFLRRVNPKLMSPKLLSSKIPLLYVLFRIFYPQLHDNELEIFCKSLEFYSQKKDELDVTAQLTGLLHLLLDLFSHHIMIEFLIVHFSNPKRCLKLAADVATFSCLLAKGITFAFLSQRAYGFIGGLKIRQKSFSLFSWSNSKRTRILILFISKALFAKFPVFMRHS